MKYRVLGKTGWKVSEIGFGAWQIGGAHWGDQKDDDSLKALHASIDRGVNFIDTAAFYGDGRSERLIGKVLKERSEDIYVCTKTPPDEGPWPPTPYCRSEERYSEEYLRKNVEERMQMLGVNQLDILLLHTWTRAWNKDPYPLKILDKLKKEGKIKFIGISTPEHDQNSINDLIRDGFIDVAEVIYNIFEQEPTAQLFPLAEEHNVGIIGRVPFDEASLTGKFTKDTKFTENDFRNKYFSGDRLNRTLERVEKLERDIEDTDLSLIQIALLFVLEHTAISTVIPGMRNIDHVKANTAVSDLPPLSKELLKKLRDHAWQKAFWYGG
ncbi:MAG: aldo/keto reductase [Spirochaetota bacterium]|nr:MAG: aldo/keto reductase [Spirochaetota bacterium]